MLTLPPSGHLTFRYFPLITDNVINMIMVYRKVMCMPVLQTVGGLPGTLTPSTAHSVMELLLCCLKVFPLTPIHTGMSNNFIPEYHKIAYNETL